MSDHYDNTGITGRAWFKPLVALWFGALAAAGMWFMPPGVHGSIVSATRLDRVHPLFSQPLDQQGIMALCAIAGLVGLLIGLLIAWRIAVASSPRAFAPGFEVHDDDEWTEGQSGEDDFEQPRRRRVFSAREDIGEQGIAVTAPQEDGDYEDEYTFDEVPASTPEEEFETVYAELEEDYPSADESPAFEDHSEWEAHEVEEPEILDADFVEAEDEVAEPVPHDVTEEAPAPRHAPPPVSSADEIPLGDMSLDALLDRLEGALEQHSRMVGDSERAARDPAPHAAPMRTAAPPRQAAGVAEDDDDTQGLPEVSEDDPVIAFLRREANRRMPGSQGGQRTPGSGEKDGEESSSNEAQAALRSALDRLGQTGHRD